MLQVSARLVKRFNSLQTGKRIRISHQPLAISHQQRGVSVEQKPLIAEGLRKPKANSHYSIPFKREGVSKDCAPRNVCERERGSVSIPFKRESVSKAYKRRMACLTKRCVSIPFKRESGSQADNNAWNAVASICGFQFPSNGKANCK